MKEPIVKEGFCCVLAGFLAFFLMVIGWPYLALVVIAAAMYPLTTIAVTATLIATRGEL